MNENNPSAQPNGSGIVDVGAAMAGRNADPHKLKLPNPITMAQEGEDEEKEEKEEGPQVGVPDLIEHLKGFELPDTLPSGLKEAFDLLHSIDKLPEDSPVRERAKRELMDRIKKHCFNLQQGLPILNMTADDQGDHEHREAIYLENAIKQLAATHPPVKMLLEAYEELVNGLNENRPSLQETQSKLVAITADAEKAKAELASLSDAHAKLKGELESGLAESEKAKAASAAIAEENAKLKEQLNALRSASNGKKK